MKKLHQLTELQLTIMDVLWRRKEATVVDVHEAIAERTGLARKTVGTLVSRLEQQGLLTHREEGREYVYRPTVSRSEVGRATVHNIFANLFPGDLPALVSHALEADEIRPGDLERVRELLDDWERRKHTGDR